MQGRKASIYDWAIRHYINRTKVGISNKFLKQKIRCMMYPIKNIILPR